MRLFRSEEEIDDWCAAHGRERGAVLTLEELERLATAWYGDRLRADWRPRTREESEAVLAGLGLGGEFWRLG
jgi:hypothetical protein